MKKIFVVIYSSAYDGDVPYIECNTFANKAKAKEQFRYYIQDIILTEQMNKEKAETFYNDCKDACNCEYHSENGYHTYTIKIVEQEVIE